jgi:ligand-binding sensor domain-containing protein
MTGKPVYCGFLIDIQKFFFCLKCCIYCLILLTTVSEFSFSQEPVTQITNNNYRPVAWKRSDGISLPKKNVMLKDIEGFVWMISPVGLNRFDGSTFKIYHPDKNTRGTIAGTYGFSLVEDSLHNIWVGTNKGLSRFDIKADTFKNFLPGILSVNPIAPAIPFWATRNEIFCIESGSVLTTYSIHTLEKRLVVALDKNGPLRNVATIPQSVYDSLSNSVFIITGQVGVAGGGLEQLLLNDKKTVQHQWPCFKGISGHAHYSYGMRYDKRRNSIWINSTDGLIEFTLYDKKFHEVTACNDLMDLATYEIVAGIELDVNGKVWLNTNARGILIYDPINKSVAPLFNDPDLQRKISAENMSIYYDRDGMVWLGYLPAEIMYQLIPFNPSVERLGISVPDSLKNEFYVNNIIQGTRNQLWISTSIGLWIFDPRTSICKPAPANEFPGFNNTFSVALGVDSFHRKAWFSDKKNRSLYEMDLVTRKSRKLPFKDMLQKEVTDYYINYGIVVPYKRGILFHLAGKGIYTVESNSEAAQEVMSTPFRVSNIALAEDKMFFRLHFGYTNQSFREVNGKWTRISTPIDSIEWSCLYFNRLDRSYWVGGVKQLYHISEDFKVLRKYTDKDGLPGIDVLCILGDDMGNVWLNNTDGDISQVNGKTGVLSVLSEKDGYKIQDFAWQPTNFKDAAGNIYLSGVDGVDRIRPGRVGQFPSSSVYFKSLGVGQQDIGISTGVNQIEKLSLKYFEAPIIIETGVIDYFSKGKNTIRYKLEGINNNDWQYAPANYTIRFEKLPPGKYKLVIQASNSGNNFNGPEKTLAIIVSPAFWNTWWFISAVALFVLMISYVLIRARVKEKFRLQLERSKKDKQLTDMRQKTMELEMQALRAQMNPHFIFNSLNSINRFILQNNRTQASEYLTKFSKLVRLILQNSQASLITLESELESLELYLDLESLRFNHHFEYRISKSPELDISALKVPPLIIQPYVENAIWHGLMHKEEKGNLDIEISQEDNLLFIRIADDGIGRKQSSALSSKSATRHKSMGLQITADRIAMIQPAGSREVPVKIIDLVASDGSSAGTEIIITIPVIYD